MENKAKRDFIIKFDKLNPDNQRYLIAVQQALAFAQISSLESEKTTKEKGRERAS